MAGEVDGQPPVGIQLRGIYPTSAGTVEVRVPVETSDRRFAAWVPLVPGALGVTALAQDAVGRSGEGTFAFSFAPAPGGGERPMRPDVEPTTGFAPLTVTFGCGVGPDAVALELDVDGDGLADFDLADCAEPPHRVTHTYFAEGPYVATLTVRDRTGASGVQQVPINVLPLPDLGRLWDGFRAALARADVEGALGFIAFEARERYRRALEDLRSDLATVAAGLGLLTPARLQPRSATATTTRVLDGGAAVFVVSFVRDGDGVWRLASF